jgi:hypothetical protein
LNHLYDEHDGYSANRLKDILHAKIVSVEHTRMTKASCASSILWFSVGTC